MNLHGQSLIAERSARVRGQANPPIGSVMTKLVSVVELDIVKPRFDAKTFAQDHSDHSHVHSVKHLRDLFVVFHHTMSKLRRHILMPSRIVA